MKKTKNQLIQEANEVATTHQFKKDVIEKMLNDLDQNKQLSEAHLEGMSIIQGLLEELDDLEKKYEEIKKQIKS